MWLDILLIVIGFALLIVGASWLVDGASSLAKRMGISALTIGLTVVAFGTSAPELTVNVVSSISGNTEIALGNIVGSNIFNILLILGIAAMVRPVAVDRSSIRVDIPLNMMLAVLLFVLANDTLIDGASHSGISRIDGLVLLTMFAVFIYYTFKKSNTVKNESTDTQPLKPLRATWLSLLMVIGGLAMLVLGGRAVVRGAVNIAQMLGISQAVIGLTIVAVGTSLPELFTSVIAAYKNEPDIAMGNVVGSSIFNSSLVLGISSVITPIPSYATANCDLLVHAGASILLLLFAILQRKRTINRVEGALMTIFFTLYMAYLISNA